MIICMSFTASKTYGEYNHTLSESEIPTHRHTTCHYIQGNSEWSDVISENLTVVTRFGEYFPGSKISVGHTGYTNGETNNVFTAGGARTTSAGNDNPHNNIQPCITVYFWRKVS